MLLLRFTEIEDKAMNEKKQPRVSGILLHPTSLPSPYGIGDLGQAAYDFIDFLKASGQHLWQTLPLTPTGFGDSPYQGFSAFAGQPLLISPKHLVELGLLYEHELGDCPVGDETSVDYGSIIPWKTHILNLAFSRFQERDTSELWVEYEVFLCDHSFWLEDYALYMSCKDLHDGREWLAWDPAYRTPNDQTKKELKERLQGRMKYYYFVQFIFYKEWMSLKAYANKNGIEIIGDIPLFLSLDSADVWANQDLFQLDSEGFPTVVAGVPPDYFSETGQLWGNPLYNWEKQKTDGFKWWIARVRHQLQLTDYLRIDHFRGLESYWAIPYGEETAINGTWVPGPGADLFVAIENALGKDLPIIAEDLGIITPEVEALRDQFGFPGMRILQFGFDSQEESTFLPHQFTTANCVCYTGTHDNNTTKGWYASASEYSRDKVRYYMNTDGYNIHWDFLRTCLGTIATYAIIPLQDVLGIGEEGRMNTPGVGTNNWAWRYQRDALSEGLAEGLARITRIYGR